MNDPQKTSLIDFVQHLWRWLLSSLTVDADQGTSIAISVSKVMAHADMFLEQAKRLLDMASRCSKNEMAEAMRTMADTLLELARKDAEICVDCAQPCVKGSNCA